MVIKSNKGKPPLFATATVSHYLYNFNFAILFKVIPQVVFFCIFLNSPNKYFFYCQVSPRPLRILKLMHVKGSVRHVQLYITSNITGSPILRCQDPVGAAAANWLPLHPTGAVAASAVSWGGNVHPLLPRKAIGPKMGLPRLCQLFYWQRLEHPLAASLLPFPTHSPPLPLLLWHHLVHTARTRVQQLLVLPSVGSIYSLKCHKHALWQFTTPRAGGTHVPLASWSIGLGPLISSLRN